MSSLNDNSAGAKKHYDDLLARVYSWMTGDLGGNVAAFKDTLKSFGIQAGNSSPAVDLGSGHGIQSLAMLEHGYEVTALDFSEHLLAELRRNAGEKKVRTICDDLVNFRSHLDGNPHLIVCWGDTLTHLASHDQVDALLADIANVLSEDGVLLLAFRDYTSGPPGTRKIIPVKSDATRIMTCILDYGSEKTNVTDLVHELTDKGWELFTGTYSKLRLDPENIIDKLRNLGMLVEKPVSERGQIIIHTWKATG